MSDDLSRKSASVSFFSRSSQVDFAFPKSFGARLTIISLDSAACGNLHEEMLELLTLVACHHLTQFVRLKSYSATNCIAGQLTFVALCRLPLLTMHLCFAHDVNASTLIKLCHDPNLVNIHLD